MKYISYRDLGWLVCFLLFACQSEVITEQANGNTLQVLSVDLDNGGNTKAEVTSSISNVKVYTTTAANAEIAENTLVVYNNDGSSWSCDTPPELTDDTYNVYAYYPLQRGDGGEVIAAKNNTGGDHTIPVLIYTEDSFDDQQQDDYLYADQTTPLTASKSTKAVRFTMKHALSKVSFEITKDESATEKLVLTQVDIIGKTNSLQTGGGDMYLQTGGLVGLQSKDQISLTGSIELKSNSLSSPNISALVAPMSKYEKVLSFRLTVLVDGVSRVFETGTVKKDDATDWLGVKWEPGVHYVYQIKVSKMGGVINGVSVYDWKKDSDQNTQVGI